MSVSLAEPRRRQKWTVNPRGNLWANDESKFGQKLMEKMGWEKGNGLGANQDGRVDNIKVKHKDNQKGVGFDGHDDTWLNHQEDFQAVLAALNVEHGVAGKDLNEEEKKVSLESISRKSKRRVHYQKFVKGKDSSNYSAEDMSCILGTKSDKLKSKQVTEQKKKSSDSSSDGEEKEEKSTKFVQKGNYQEYFAKKMAAMKAKGKYADIPTWTENTTNSSTESKTLGLGAEKIVTADNTVTEQECIEQEDNCDGKKKKKKSKKSKHVESDIVESVLLEGDVKVKKKKSKKMKSDEEVGSEHSNEESDIVESVILENEVEVKEKKSKKKKKEKDDAEVSEDHSNLETEPEHLEDSTEEKIKKKKNKKSKKAKNLDEPVEVEDDSGCENLESKEKKKKKGKKEKNREKVLSAIEANVDENSKRKSEEEISPESPPKKKRKKSKKSKVFNLPSGDQNPLLENYGEMPGFKGANLLAIPGYGNK